MKKPLILLLLIIFTFGMPRTGFCPSGQIRINHEGQHPLRHRATRINIDDAGDYYTADEVETALQEIPSTFLPANYLKIDTSNDPFTGTLSGPDIALTDLLTAARSQLTATSTSLDTLNIKAYSSIGDITFEGSGLNDMSTGGTFIGSADIDFVVEVEAAIDPDEFKWSNDGGTTFKTTGVVMTGGAQTLEHGVTVTFAATSGHTVSNQWTFTATAYSGNLTEWQNPAGTIVGSITGQGVRTFTVSESLEDTSLTASTETLNYSSPVDGTSVNTKNYFIDTNISGAFTDTDGNNPTHIVRSFEIDLDSSSVLTDGGGGPTQYNDAIYVDVNFSGSLEASSTVRNRGIYARSRGNMGTTGATSHYAAYFQADGTANVNQGVYSIATGGTTNWDFWGAAGNMALDTDGGKYYSGEAQDGYWEHDGDSLNIVANIIAGTDDLEITADDVLITADAGISDATPHLTFRNSGDDSAIQHHSNIDGANDPWGVYQIWRGTDADGKSFAVSPNIPLMYFDNNNHAYFTNDIRDPDGTIDFDDENLTTISKITANKIDSPPITKSYRNQSFIPVVTADNYETPFYWERAAAPLTTPTSNADNDCLHPDVVYIPGGWNGYTYWMVMTPFAGSSAALENPEILVSNDGETWSDPGTNPIDGPPGTGFFSDPCLMFYQNTLYVYWRESDAGDGDRIWLMTSTDGVAWAGPTTILDAGGVTSGTLVSPIVRNIYGTFYMWTVDSDASPNELHLRTSSIPTGSWSAATNCTLTFGGAEEIFHINIMWDGDAFYTIWTPPGSLFFGKSYDGENWDMGGVPLVAITTGGEWDENKYQSALIRRPDRNYFDVFYSAYETTGVNLHRIGRGKLHWTDGDDTGNLHGYVNAGAGSRYLNIKDTFLKIKSDVGAAAIVLQSNTDNTAAADDPRIHFQHGATPATKVTMGYDSSADTFIIARLNLASSPGITLNSTGQAIFYNDVYIDGNSQVLGFGAGGPSAPEYTIAWTGNAGHNILSGNYVFNGGSLGVGAAPSELIQATGASGTDGATPVALRLHSTTVGGWVANAPFAEVQFANADGSGDGAGGVKAKIAALVGEGTGTVTELAFYVSASGTSIAEKMRIDYLGRVGLGETSPQDTLEVNGTGLFKDALKFTQDDGNEKIDSANDGYMDYYATTTHRFNNDIDISDDTPHLRFWDTDNNITYEWHLDPEDTPYQNFGLWRGVSGDVSPNRPLMYFDNSNNVHFPADSRKLIRGVGDDVADFWDGDDWIFDMRDATSDAGSPDLIVVLDDNAGGTYFAINDSDDAVQWWVNSDGSTQQSGALVVGTRISSGTLTITASSDTTDVSGINTLFINPAGATVIGGFVGGVAGQVLYVSAIANGQDITLEHAEGIGGTTQDIYLHSGIDETLSTEYGGWTLTCDGTNWYDTSHAKHVQGGSYEKSNYCRIDDCFVCDECVCVRFELYSYYGVC